MSNIHWGCFWKASLIPILVLTIIALMVFAPNVFIGLCSLAIIAMVCIAIVWCYKDCVKEKKRNG